MKEKHIEKIINYCQWIENYFSKKLNFKKFKENEEMVYAFAFVLSQIGEHANKLDFYEKNKYPNVPWHDIVGLRHKIIHHYSGIDLNIIYDICMNDIPILLNELTK